MVGQVSAVSRLEAAERGNSLGQILPLLLQITEHFAAAGLDVLVKLLGPAERIRLHPLGVDARLRFDPLRPRTGVGRDLMSDTVRFLADPIRVFGGLIDQTLSLSVDISTKRTTAELASLLVVTTMGPPLACGGAAAGAGRGC